MKRSIVTTYYGPGSHRPIVKRTYSSNPLEVQPNITRNMAVMNKYGAVVAEAHDEEYGELLCVATYFIGEEFRIVPHTDVHRPVLVTNLPESGEPA